MRFRMKKINHLHSAEENHQRVETESFTKGRWSLTLWVENNTSRGSEQGFAPNKVITYILSAEQDHPRVRTRSCNKARWYLQAKCRTKPSRVRTGSCTKGRWSLTSWVQNNTIRGSKQGLAPKEHHNVGRQLISDRQTWEWVGESERYIQIPYSVSLYNQLYIVITP